MIGGKWLHSRLTASRTDGAFRCFLCCKIFKGLLSYCKKFMATQVLLCSIFWTFFQSAGNFGDPSLIQVWWLPRETTRDTSCGMSEIFKGELGSEVKGFILGWKDSAERTVAHNLNEIWHGCESWSGNGPGNVSRVERIRWSDLLSRQEFDSDLTLFFGFGEVEMGAATNLSWLPIYRGRTPTMVHHMRFVLEGLENLFLQFSWWNVWRSQIEDSFGFARKLAWRQNHGEAAMFENLSDTWVCVSFQFLVSFDSHFRLHRGFSLTAWEMATSTLKAPHINMITLLRHHTVPYVHAFAWIFLNFSKFLCISMHYLVSPLCQQTSLWQLSFNLKARKQVHIRIT